MKKRIIDSPLSIINGMLFSFNLNQADKYNLELSMCPWKCVRDERKWADLEFKNLTQEEMKDVVNAFYRMADWIRDAYTQISGDVKFKRCKHDYMNFTMTSGYVDNDLGEVQKKAVDELREDYERLKKGA